METIDSLLVFDPKDEDAEILKLPKTLPTEEDDNAGDGGGVPTLPKQRSYTIIVIFKEKIFIFTEKCHKLPSYCTDNEKMLNWRPFNIVNIVWIEFLHF